MSPNGRRAWREWVRRQDLRRKHKQPKGSICRMARQARRHIPVVPGVVVSTPFTARSLVGMTMGSRKRAAQAAGVARPTYRIGQKLCPCVGCLRCQCRAAFDAWPELGEELAKDHPTCDGSGVLLARKSK